MVDHILASWKAPSNTTPSGDNTLLLPVPPKCPSNTKFPELYLKSCQEPLYDADVVPLMCKLCDAWYFIKVPSLPL